MTTFAKEREETGTRTNGQKHIDTEAERQYARGIINSLSSGILHTYNAALAGNFAQAIELLLEDYDASDIRGFNAALDAVKIQHPEVKRLVEEEPDPDYATSKTGQKVFKRLTGDEIWELPDIEWLVSGMLQRSTTTLVVGTGNVGKTFMWLDACLSIAYGEKWLNRKTRQGRVLYIYAEGRGGLKQRYKAWMIEHGKATLREITDPTNQISFIPRPVNLLNDKDMLFSTIEDEPEMPEEVVIDTFSMCAGGVDENSNSQVAQYLATASEIKLKYGCHVTIIHHCNKSGGFRGASALRDNVDTMITLDREDKEGPIKVGCDKQRDADLFPPFHLNLKVVDLGVNTFTNEPISSCVVELADGGTSAKNTMSEKQVKMLEVLDLHGSLTSGKWQKECLDAGITKDSFTYNVKALAEQGKIQKTEYTSGKQQRVSYSIAKEDMGNEDEE